MGITPEGDDPQSNLIEKLYVYKKRKNLSVKPRIEVTPGAIFDKKTRWHTWVKWKAPEAVEMKKKEEQNKAGWHH